MSASGAQPRSIGKLLKGLGFSHISARPRHPRQDERTIEAQGRIENLEELVRVAREYDATAGGGENAGVAEFLQVGLGSSGPWPHRPGTKLSRSITIFAPLAESVAVVPLISLKFQ